MLRHHAARCLLSNLALADVRLIHPVRGALCCGHVFGVEEEVIAQAFVFIGAPLTAAGVAQSGHLRRQLIQARCQRVDCASIAAVARDRELHSPFRLHPLAIALMFVLPAVQSQLHVRGLPVGATAGSSTGSGGG